jgi:hypothetical protein
MQSNQKEPDSIPVLTAFQTTPQRGRREGGQNGRQRRSAVEEKQLKMI